MSSAPTTPKMTSDPSEVQVSYGETDSAVPVYHIGPTYIDKDANKEPVDLEGAEEAEVKVNDNQSPDASDENSSVSTDSQIPIITITPPDNDDRFMIKDLTFECYHLPSLGCTDPYDVDFGYDMLLLRPPYRMRTTGRLADQGYAQHWPEVSVYPVIWCHAWRRNEAIMEWKKMGGLPPYLEW
jgi:hypothetical protein